LIFVPLTTISMDAIPRERMGNATSLFSLMRNLGGSIGIAVTGTLLARKQQVYISTMGRHIDAYSARAQQTLEQLRQGFMAAGSDPVTAGQRAYAAMFGIVQRQAAMLSFVDLFRMLGVMFLLLLPLILLMKRPRSAASAAAAH
jgi:DHA2 family multidrug resistance protein